MTQYRVYRVDPAGHISVPAIPIECQTDQEATEQARRYVGVLAVELWRGSEVIHRFEAVEP